jgi:hypothetical protein
MDKNKEAEKKLRGDKSVPDEKPQGMKAKQASIPDFKFSLTHTEWDKMKRNKPTFERVMQRELKKAVRHALYEFAPLILNAAVEQFLAMEATQVLIAKHPELKDVNTLRSVIQEAVNKMNNDGSIDKIAAEADKIATKKGL